MDFSAASSYVLSLLTDAAKTGMEVEDKMVVVEIVFRKFLREFGWYVMASIKIQVNKKN